MARDAQLCTFEVGGMAFGLDVACIQEVLRHQPVTGVPLAPAMVAGLVNLRGQIITAIDLRRRLDLPPCPPGARPLNVVLRTGDGAVSLLVDDIGDVIEVDAGGLEPPPASLPARIRGAVRGAYQHAGRLLLVLDATQTLEPDDDN